MNEKQLDYLFDLQGYLILRNAISKEDLREMNRSPVATRRAFSAPDLIIVFLNELWIESL